MGEGPQYRPIVPPGYQWGKDSSCGCIDVGPIYSPFDPTPIM